MRRGTSSKVPPKAAAFLRPSTQAQRHSSRATKTGRAEQVWDGMSLLTVVTPKKLHAEGSGSLLGKRTRSLHSGTPNGAAACANAELVEIQVLVASSDSEEDVEYIAPALQYDDDDDDFIEVCSKNKSISNDSRATAGSTTLVNASTRANKVDCMSNDIEIVSVTAQQPTIVTTPRRGPTIRRYNSQSITQPIVLAEDTQEYFGGSSGFAGYIFGDHIGGSAIPETPPLPPHASPQVMRADLSSDPISEFRTPINSPSRANASPHTPVAGPESDSIQFSDDHRDGAVESPKGPGITQWYREGLQMCEGDSEEYTQGESQGLEDPSQFLDGFDDELRFDNDNEPESILIGDDSEDDEEVIGGNTDKSRDTRATIGFWDLRKPGAYSERDRAMYLNQFAPSDRQVAMRERKRTRTDNAHGSFDVLQDNGLPPLPYQQPRRAVSTRGRGHGGSGTGEGTGGTWGRASGSRGRASKPARGGRRTKNRRSTTAGSTTAQQHTLSSRSRVAVPVGYNYYAGEPALDLSASLNWEGGGISRFG
ncbi:hypothetical protein BX661DRAFT_184765 [Kickxella alabastrina]|uniref:uncharacterized protein n=1 Tax=Kickxella alabastrina TaxID=61397 RepID=UPI00221F666F|nr:uncharacterized protein BX661DRAFT_184765 [Kickxella alabastrina]KAI7825527.1 hypothetical protein BX661DRAFT_184765 [Kickxella alabastrina]